MTLPCRRGRRGLPVILLLAGCGGEPRRRQASMPVPERPQVMMPATIDHDQHGSAVIDQRDGLSPDEAAFVALDRNPQLRAIRSRRGVAQAEIVAAGLLPNPRLDGSLSVPVAGGDAQVLGYGIGLAWNVTPLLARSARVRAATQQSRAVDLEVAWQEWQVAQAAELHTIRLIYLAREIAVAHQAVEEWQGRLDAYRGAREALATTELQLARAERSQAEWQLRRQDLARQQIVERSALALALGLETTGLPALQMAWHPRPGDPALADLLDGLARRRVDLLALQRAQRSRDEAVRAAALARFPPIEIGVRTSRDTDGVQSIGFAVSVALPIFDRNQGQLARASARQREIGHEYEARLAQARSQTRRYVDELALLREQIATAHAADKAAARLAILARSAALSGALDPTLAADQQDSAYRARLRTLRIEESYAEVAVALSLASGMLAR